MTVPEAEILNLMVLKQKLTCMVTCLLPHQVLPGGDIMFHTPLLWLPANAGGRVRNGLSGTPIPPCKIPQYFGASIY